LALYQSSTDYLEDGSKIFPMGINLPQKHTNIKICKKCVLPETFFGIRFEEQEVCNYSRQKEPVVNKVKNIQEKYHHCFDLL